MKSWYKVILAVVFVFVMVILAMTFPGGNSPHQVTLDNGETAIAYDNGTVYTREGLGTFDQRTLWQAEDGRIMLNRPIIAYRAYLVVPLVATPKEINIWQQAMTAIHQ